MEGKGFRDGGLRSDGGDEGQIGWSVEMEVMRGQIGWSVEMEVMRASEMEASDRVEGS